MSNKSVTAAEKFKAKSEALERAMRLDVGEAIAACINASCEAYTARGMLCPDCPIDALRNSIEALKILDDVPRYQP